VVEENRPRSTHHPAAITRLRLDTSARCATQQMAVGIAIRKIGECSTLSAGQACRCWTPTADSPQRRRNGHGLAPRHARHPRHISARPPLHAETISNPVPGIYRAIHDALRCEYPAMKMGITSWRRIQRQRISRRRDETAGPAQPRDETAIARSVINCVGFPTTIPTPFRWATRACASRTDA